MANSSSLFKAFVVGSPVCILLLNEIRRVKNLRDDEKINKSLFIKNFHKSNFTKKGQNNGDDQSRERQFDQVNTRQEGEEEALNYFYGKAWGYTTDYEIDLSLNTGDLIFIKHDLENVSLIKKALLKMNRYVQQRSNSNNNLEDYDEVGIILKKHNISYVYIQNVLNGKDKLMRYSHFLQKYKPSVLSLRRFVTDDEHIKKELHKNILQSVQRQEQMKINSSSILFNLLRNLCKQRILLRRNMNDSPQKKDCLCNDSHSMCKQISYNIDMNNLINMLIFRSFNLFFYFVSYMNEQALKSSPLSRAHVLLQNVSSDKHNIGKEHSCIIDKQNGLQGYEFSLGNSLTQFEFIEGDSQKMNPTDIPDRNKAAGNSYHTPSREVAKEIENFLALLLENEYTLMDTTEYMNKVLRKGRNHPTVNTHKEGEVNHFADKMKKQIEKVSLIFQRFSVTNNHVYEIYRNTNLLPSIKNYDPPPSLFLCLNNFYKPINGKNIQRDTFSVPKLTNLFHVRQEETEKLQRYFYQFNRVPKS
ncbi:conserved Plasmodium protein, unknown function [Plasmodium knowlesi strain H]|uniref:Uncharacterized protein n=3 Tax=Plasmodium knowlesi TaxID=5850 RepID=A0A5K1VBM6_PLAKH|nr:conserved protein, unknown function [Plasmodium knowlesi strain H]OTN64803.1 Uncharacterized protein PKNOH_S120138000 [Plasmodium knowlesi]CAA9988239.1 conserved protein, unknown function [Plasmodium knowlesi strain H]SBO20169.1 conserved Plasmodium protein, unknown function [Plasmodium knowlesi strain H]SBO20524.1 conserved Plasmodium protein, unknown function [Plasmodium knowlesi strain H]VVS77713.1 conserved protein, unknown function [Plasmodium knowlesi strain H]|eukprot:XP_002259216.1 hypothetical protein, conserved in Plasmodium species [Plasmodium knowlesi strain H]